MKAIDLRVGADQTTLGAATLDIGWRTISHVHLKSDPASPLDLENAIAAIEDEIARVHQAVERDSTVVTTDTDETIREIALASGVRAGAGMALSPEAVERAYARLTGRAGLPGTRRFAATLLILRELMHHLQIGRIVIEGGGGAAQPPPAGDS
ncbi:MAG TPA: hypothetical protein VFK84_08600 [Burkholderiales bacterium]|nr:hypothetical protein [Burkholderiales bacterium]